MVKSLLWVRCQYTVKNTQYYTAISDHKFIINKLGKDTSTRIFNQNFLIAIGE